MCKFCEEGDRLKEGKFAIYMTKWSDERGTTLSVDFDGFDESSDADFEVNFCPICGKQLKQVQESTELTEAFKVLRENGYEPVEAVLATIEPKSNELEDVKAAIAEQGYKVLGVSYNRRLKVLFIETDKCAFVGSYNFDEETGKTFVNLEDIDYELGGEA